jgi:hypothetical protein
VASTVVPFKRSLFPILIAPEQTLFSGRVVCSNKIKTGTQIPGQHIPSKEETIKTETKR